MARTEVSNKKIGKVITLAIIPLLFWRFYWYVGFDQDKTALFSFLIAVILVVYLGVIWVKGRLNTYLYKSRYSKLILFFLMNVFLSFFTALIYWGQGMVLTFRAGYISFVIIFFFVLYSVRLSYNEAVKFILIFSGIYLVLWLYGLSQYPQVVFGNLEELNNTRGLARISHLQSLDMVYLSYFLSLVNVTLKTTKNKVIWLVLLIVSFLLIIGTLTRMAILSIILVSSFYLFRRRKRYFIVFTVIFIVAFGYIINTEIVSSLMDLSQEEFSSGSESALRVVEYTMFPKLYPFRLGTFLFGNGYPHVLSSYGMYEESLKSTYAFNRSDAGYVGMYVTYGVFCIILFTVLLIRVLKQKVSPKAMPFKLFVIFLYMINITAWEFFRLGIGFMLALYILNKDYNNTIETTTTVSPNSIPII